MRLYVVHAPKSMTRVPLSGAEGFDFFELDTCQRRIWVTYAQCAPELAALPPGFEIHEEEAAYRLLLEITTGLKSEVQGETDIFGQFKEAWQRFEMGHTCLAQSLAPWMRRLFEDTKEIRSQFLRNVGGDSYGSLVRKIFAARNAQTSEPVLVLGAGQIAQSVAPWLSLHPLWIWNRSKEKLAQLESEILARNPAARVRRIEDGELNLALERAGHVLVCIPPRSPGDAERVSRLAQADAASNRAVIHLGIGVGDEEARAEWNGLSGFYTLGDLLQMLRQQKRDRSFLIERAVRACAEKARLRFMPGSPKGSAHLAHGWEDLVEFAWSIG